MNLALHGFLLQVILCTLNFKHGFKLCSAGEPGYLDFDNLPETNFSCQGKVIGGYYADVEAGCQMFHVCTIGQKDEIMDIKFLCLNGTVFDQETRVCERVDEVDCSKSERFYNLNLELYGNNAVTLSLHEEDDSTEPRDDHEQQQQQKEQQQQQHQQQKKQKKQQLHMTSMRPIMSSSTTTTTSRSSQPSTTLVSNVYQQHSAGYPQHYQPQPPFSSIQTSQSNTHYNNKNGGYHHQYIFHNDERNNNNQATSYQLFSNQGVSSTMANPPVHQQVQYSSTATSQVIHNEPSTVMTLQFHVQSTSSTIETLLNNNNKHPSLINPLFHNHGVTSTTEQFNIHSNNPREITHYQDNSDEEEDEHGERIPLEPIQSTNKGKVSKLTISPVPQQESRSSVVQTKSSQTSQQHRISINYLPTPTPIQTTISDFYLTQRPTSQKPQKLHNNQQIPQHIHVLPPPLIPQLKPHQVTINLPPPDIQRIVQNPSPLLPSQSRVIVTAKASVSDESGRPLNASQLITLPLPTIPSNYDDYKEGDESFDPFYRDVPKIRNNRRIIISNKIDANKKNLRKKRSHNYEQSDEVYPSEEVIFNSEIKNIKDLKENLPIIKAILFGLPTPENKESSTKIKDLHIYNTYNNTSNKTLNFTRKTMQEFMHKRHNYMNITNKNSSRNIYVSPIQNQEKKDDYIIPRISNNNDNVNINHKKDELEISTHISNTNENSEHPNNTFLQREKIFEPIFFNQDSVDIEPEHLVQLFFQSNESTHSQSQNKNLSIPIELLNRLNITHHVNNKTDQIKYEVLQTRSSNDSHKFNIRKDVKNESLEEFKEFVEFLIRRNIYNNKPIIFRHYEKYNIDENVGLNPRQRSNTFRKRSQSRDQINYRSNFEDNVSDIHKNVSRRGLQGSQFSYQNRNRHYDYEDIKIYEKPKLAVKTVHRPSRIKENFQYDRIYDSRTQRSDLKSRKNETRHFLLSNEEIQIKEFDLKSKSINFPQTLQEQNKNIKYSLKKQNMEDQSSEKTIFNSFKNNTEFVEKQMYIIKKDQINQNESYSDEYNESKEQTIYADYLDYVDLKDQTREIVIDNHKNTSQFKKEFEAISRRKSDYRNNSKKFVEEKKIIQDTLKKIINTEYIESTTLKNEQITIITNESIANKAFNKINTIKKYDYYDTTKLLSTTDNIINSKLLAHTKISTEGVFKFTDELPFIEKKYKVQNDYKQNDEIMTNKEDYIDDNYEPESYINPTLKEPLLSIQKTNQNDKYIFTVKEQPIEIKIKTDNTALNISDIKIENKEEYDKIYDKIENRTTSLTSQDCIDLKITTDSFSLKTLNPISSALIATSTNNTFLDIPISMMTITTNPRAMMTSTKIPTPSILTMTTPKTITKTLPLFAIPIKNAFDPITRVSTQIRTLKSMITSIHMMTIATSITTTTAITPTFATITTLPTITRNKATTKFFKPITFRKNYAYVPLSSTPNSVVIRHSYSLSGQKPTKPSLSYNDLASKPVIRRLPLLSRTTTSTSDATIFEDDIVVELPKHEENKTFIPIKNESFSFETVIDYPVPKLLPSIKSKNNEIVTKDSDSKIMNYNNETFMIKNSLLLIKQNQTILIKEPSFDKEVPKYNSRIQYSKIKSQLSENLMTKQSKSEFELSNYNQSIFKAEITTITPDSNNLKILDTQKTTLRTLRPLDRKLELTSVKSQIQKVNQSPKPIAGFNCLEKEMYRFYGDVRDCRLFHYCSPGFTMRQVLDFRFVCEEGTIFDEESQSCRHDVPNPKCVKRTW